MEALSSASRGVENRRRIGSVGASATRALRGSALAAALCGAWIVAGSSPAAADGTETPTEQDRVARLEEALAHIMRHRGVWAATGSEILDAWTSSQQD